MKFYKIYDPHAASGIKVSLLGRLSFPFACQIKQRVPSYTCSVLHYLLMKTALVITNGQTSTYQAATLVHWEVVIVI